jgi:hypothetical protein
MVLGRIHSSDNGVALTSQESSSYKSNGSTEMKYGYLFTALGFDPAGEVAAFMYADIVLFLLILFAPVIFHSMKNKK